MSTDSVRFEILGKFPITIDTWRKLLGVRDTTPEESDDSDNQDEGNKNLSNFPSN